MSEGRPEQVQKKAEHESEENESTDVSAALRDDDAENNCCHAQAGYP
jgi:hypothetical protein